MNSHASPQSYSYAGPLEIYIYWRVYTEWSYISVYNPAYAIESAFQWDCGVIIGEALAGHDVHLDVMRHLRHSRLRYLYAIRLRGTHELLHKAPT